MNHLPQRDSFRDTTHYAIAIASELLALPLRAYARSRSRGAATSPASWRRALIVGHGHIGDVLCQTVALDAYRAALPECELHYLTTSVGASTLRNNPAIAEVYPWNDGARTSDLEHGAVERLRSAAFDAILCTNVVRHQDALTLALQLGVPNRVAFVHRGLSGLVTLPVHVAAPAPPPVLAWAMARAVTGAGAEGELRPRVFTAQEDEAAAETEWQRLGLERARPTIAVAATTRQSVGRVPPVFFARVLTELQRIQPGVQIVLTGSEADTAALREINSAAGAAFAISAGQLEILAYAAFLRKCDSFFGMDSGPRHLANAAGIPVVFVRNLAVRAAEAGAYCATETDVAPAGDYLDEAGVARAVASIDPGAVAAIILLGANSRAERGTSPGTAR